MPDRPFRITDITNLCSISSSIRIGDFYRGLWGKSSSCWSCPSARTGLYSGRRSPSYQPPEPKTHQVGHFLGGRPNFSQSGLPVLQLATSTGQLPVAVSLDSALFQPICRSKRPPVELPTTRKLATPRICSEGSWR
jgi:hypothetical protein